MARKVAPVSPHALVRKYPTTNFRARRPRPIRAAITHMIAVVSSVENAPVSAELGGTHDHITNRGS